MIHLLLTGRSGPWDKVAAIRLAHAGDKKKRPTAFCGTRRIGGGSFFTSVPADLPLAAPPSRHANPAQLIALGLGRGAHDATLPWCP